MMTAYTRAGRKIAEESQLLAEERWIIEAIKKIRTQRNCLQIERLQLESMLSSQKLGTTKDHVVDTEKIVADNLNETNPTTMLQNMQSTVEMASFDVPQMDEQLCNIETLDLSVTNPIKDPFRNIRFTEDEEEDENDDMDDNDEMVIDMNMFMNSNVM